MEFEFTEVSNEMIGKKIGLARKERDFTQGQLAEYLNRTTSNISDFERGKVQVSAAELYKISQILNKPIEYFYGDFFYEDDIEDLVALTRRQPKETRKSTIDLIETIITMQQMGDNLDASGGEPTREELVEFFQQYLNFKAIIDMMNKQLDIVSKDLAALMKSKGIDIK